MEGSRRTPHRVFTEPSTSPLNERHWPEGRDLHCGPVPVPSLSVLNDTYQRSKKGSLNDTIRMSANVKNGGIFRQNIRENKKKGLLWGP